MALNNIQNIPILFFPKCLGASCVPSDPFGIPISSVSETVLNRLVYKYVVNWEK